MDILVATYENLCDHIILISSDTDLLPAIKKAKAKGKIIEYIGFSHQPSVAMVANCSKSRLLTKEDLIPFAIFL
ncbi:NYN domain-containing protein [Candidatus Daviesbacteria bacterium]|nr:NYN domain-containing protein [Candidatus Daviesbacteria bacterium]